MQFSSSDTQKLIDIAQKYGVIKIFLFGSFARGDANQSSDLDVLVEFEPGRSLFDLVRLERQLKEELGLDVDVVTPNSLHPLIRERVMAEKVSVL
jgi:predicted nucleotidyltransferase